MVQEGDQKLSTWTTKRIETVINSSKQREDGIQSVIDKLFDENNNSEIKAHDLCTSEYVDKEKINRATKHTRPISEPPPTKRTRRDDHTFCFKLHCIVCGQACVEDKKHPGRRPIVKCQTADYDTSSKKRGGFKEAILEVCRKRADKQSEDVKLRVLSATCDLHAADAVYHRDCRCTFMPTSALTRVAQKNTQESTNQKVFDGVVHTMESDQSRVWTSMEVYKFYLDNGGDRDAMNNRKLVQSLSDVMGNKLLVLQNPGLASMLMFRAKAAEMVKLVEDTSDSLDLKPVAKQIVNECKSLESDECKSTYNPRINSNVVNVVKADQCGQS